MPRAKRKKGQLPPDDQAGAHDRLAYDFSGELARAEVVTRPAEELGVFFCCSPRPRILA
jgi:hypothetical protein